MFKTLSALSLLIVPMSAYAQEIPVGAPSVRVAYADLDLSRPAGRKALDRRLSRAIDRVCTASGPGSITSSHASRKCRAETVPRIAALRQRIVAHFSKTPSISAAR